MTMEDHVKQKIVPTLNERQQQELSELCSESKKSDHNGNFVTGQDDQKFDRGQEKIGQVSRGKNKTIKIISHGVKYYYVDNFNLVWFNVGYYTILNLASIYSLYILFKQVLLGNLTVTYTFIYSILLVNLGALGVTAGCHRLWAHKSYNASFNLRFFLMIAQSIAGQNSIYTWSRDHRVHHKFSDTDADPHNVSRGFFYSHIGWLLRRKHPELVEKSSGISFDDLLADPIVKFQHKNYTVIYFVIAVITPVAIPVFGWGETLFNSFFLAFIFRYVLLLHITWFVNSAAHMFGNRPYNPEIWPSENIYVSMAALGEGYHNYHHTYPMDYATSEDYNLNLTKNFIDLMAFFGAAWDLKRMGKSQVDDRKQKVKMLLKSFN